MKQYYLPSILINGGGNEGSIPILNWMFPIDAHLIPKGLCQNPVVDPANVRPSSESSRMVAMQKYTIWSITIYI